MYRIYVDESGTHGSPWMVIGALFVPNHGLLHSDLMKVKEDFAYFNKSPKKNARYKETHLSQFKSLLDTQIALQWFSKFVSSSAFFRSIVIDWSIWDGRFFGSAFEADALKKRRAYKKWLELLLQPELLSPLQGTEQIAMADLYLDRLRVVGGYDVLPELKDRFTRSYEGARPFIANFHYMDSWKDAAQCLQLCDLLNGCVYQGLMPASGHKIATRDNLIDALRPFNVKSLSPSFWKGYARNTLRDHFPKFSVWFWQPDPAHTKEVRRMKGST